MQPERTTKKEKDSGSINIRSLKKIVTIMNRAKLTELNIEQEGFKIHLKKGGDVMTQVAATTLPAMMPQAMMAAPAPMAAAPAAAGPAHAAPPVAPAADEDAGYHTIKSPMVGTFYRAPSPEASPFTEVGNQVDENSVVCIVEAMKLMNEIKAEVKGTIKKILVENAQAVEFGQPLFLVERN